MEYLNFSPLLIQILPLYHAREHLQLLLVGLEQLGHICPFPRLSPCLTHFSSFCSLVFVANGFPSPAGFVPPLALSHLLGYVSLPAAASEVSLAVAAHPWIHPRATAALFVLQRLFRSRVCLRRIYVLQNESIVL